MAKPNMPKQAKPPLVDNPFAPDLTADEAVGCYAIHNTLRITLASAKADHTTTPASQRRVVVGRLIMPLTGLEEFHKMLTTVIENMKSRGSGSDIGPRTLQ
jgi:hypothetical protein